MPRTTYELTTGTRSRGGYGSLNQAVVGSKALAVSEWADVVCWRGAEVIGITQAGGNFVPCKPIAWEIVYQEDPEPDSYADPIYDDGYTDEVNQALRRSPESFGETWDE